MTFFEEITEKVSKYAKIACDNAEKAVDKSVNQINIYSQKEKISALYEKLGKYVYENRRSLGENEIGAILKEIDDAHRILDEFIAKNAKKPPQKLCSCGYKTKSEFEYCPKCGRKF